MHKAIQNDNRLLMDRKLINLIGFKGSGKDTVGNYLAKEYDFTSIAFADSLKDSLSSIFQWDRELLEGNTVESRNWREQVDKWWAEKLHIPHFTPRFAMQNFGTDLMRNIFHDNIWIFNMEKKLQNIRGNIVISDGRFPNEIELSNAIGGISIRIKRGDDPQWMSIAEKANNGCQISEERMKSVFMVHASERAWIGQKLDYIIENNSDISDLHLKIDEMMNII